MSDTEFAENLRSILGAESAGRWILFMDNIKSSLPFLLDSAGRPKAEDIRQSRIGDAGFESWTQMVEASPAWGGLDWSIDSWKAWKRAYAVVQEHAYLRDLGLTASEINTLNREFDQFPASAEALEAAKAERADKMEAKRGNSITTLKAQLTESQGKVSTLTNRVQQLETEYDDCYQNWKAEKRRNESLTAEYHQTKGLLVAAQERASELEKDAQEKGKELKSKNGEIAKLKRQIARYQQMTWLDHLRAIFGK